MKATRDHASAPFCTRFNHSDPGIWAAERAVEAPNNLTLPPEPSEDCGSVSVAFSMTMMITGFVGNALAITLVSKSYRRREGKRKKSFLLCIGWLALTDMVGQLLTSPVVIVLYLSHQRWEQLDPSGRLCTFFGLTMTVFGLSSLFIASAMAVERALATRAPHWYSSHMKTSVTRAVLLGVWLAVLAFALLPVLGVGQYTIQWPGTWCFISTGPGGNGTNSRQNWGNVFFASAFAILGLSALVVTFACNLATIKALVSRCRAKATASQSSAQWGRITTETAIQLMGIMCVLSVCWSPLLDCWAEEPFVELGPLNPWGEHLPLSSFCLWITYLEIMMLKMIFNHTSVEHCKTYTENQDECNFFLIAVRLASLNQILDPWVYLLLRKILLQKFCQIRHHTNNSASSSISLPHQCSSALMWSDHLER
ncbi:PREDICTED: prostaglandin E2 receptor EP3 subtype isoform X1 [Bison bison bison]|uniref:Prostaglandin E2 receptor EP3 subtype n=1 Tax=Bison bison bison TaxID=43346 RepID=A0A6P3I859_BISBB|nr:PREDICTED: prostaglandin E2 receptor EP3 subtype isoform X1 [Bison bison bison]